MRHSWGAIGTASLFGLALLLVLLQSLVLLGTAERTTTALGTRPEQRQPERPGPQREPGRRAVPRQLRGLFPDPGFGPRPPRRAVA